jgi:hypothetical protein
VYTLADKLRVVGIATTCAGLLCFPHFGISPMRSLSVFTALADLGLLGRLGVITTAVGVAIFSASFLLNKKH